MIQNKYIYKTYVQNFTENFQHMLRLYTCKFQISPYRCETPFETFQGLSPVFLTGCLYLSPAKLLGFWQ